MTARKPIPAELTRALMIEAGYRCAIPTCRTVHPLEIEHIEEYSGVEKHEFENMIVLCANCHRMKGSGPRALDRKALKIIKANLGLINYRYNDTERRILEYFAQNPEEEFVLLPETPVLFGYLLKDGLIEGEREGKVKGACMATVDDSDEPYFLSRGYKLTEAGQELVDNLRTNIAVD